MRAEAIWPAVMHNRCQVGGALDPTRLAGFSPTNYSLVRISSTLGSTVNGLFLFTRESAGSVKASVARHTSRETVTEEPCTYPLFFVTMEFAGGPL